MNEKNQPIDNMRIYNLLSTTPQEARKEIAAGRLKGMTDINPMWRIKKLTETFGICGIGWKYVITSKRLENGCKGQISAFVDIDLFVKVDGVWSDAIQGTGGSSFVADEKSGLYQSDECFKMALTDAISVSCKALGMSSDIYFGKDRTKYDNEPIPTQLPTPQQPAPQQQAPEKPYLNILNKDGSALEPKHAEVKAYFETGGSLEKIKDKYRLSKATEDYITKTFLNNGK